MFTIADFGHVVHAVYFRAFDCRVIIILCQSSAADTVNRPVFQYLVACIQSGKRRFCSDGRKKLWVAIQFLPGDRL